MDDRGSPVPNANIAVLQKNNTISNFTFSNSDGAFLLKISTTDDTLTIKATRLGYDTGLFRIPNRSQSTRLVIAESALKLQELTVKSPPIILRKDTIDYQVSAFQTKSDRTIGDVMKRIPGIQITESGQILYQGSPIEKYYINGLDLLEGRYNLANNNLPADAVRKVQVMESDQPIKILKSKVFSDKTSINIQLKKFTTTGSAQIGVGASPALWNANITPMTFNARFQAIASIQSNNIGTDLSKELEILSKSSQTASRPPTLSIQPLSKPEIQQDRWLNNKSHLLSLSLIKKTKNQTEIKFGMGMRDELQIQNGQNYTRLLTPNTVIPIDEQISNHFRTKSINTNLAVEKNTERIYLKNDSGIQFGKVQSTGELSRDSYHLSQETNSRQTRLQNNLSIITKVGKQLLNVSSKTVYNERPELLAINPGPFAEIFNAGNLFDEVSQNVQSSEFSSSNSVGLTHSFAKFSFTPTAGVSFNDHRLKSWATIIDNDSSHKAGKAFTNNFKYKHLMPFVQVNIYYQSKKWEIELNSPLRWHALKTIDFAELTDQKRKRLTLEPSITGRYQVTDYINLSSTLSYSNDFGNPAQLYSGFILRSYRNLQRGRGAIPVNGILMSRLGLTYKNPFSLVFIDVTYTMLRIKNNLQYSTRIDSTGATELAYINNSNIQNNNQLHIGTGKYFGAIKTSLKLNGSAALATSEQIVTDRKAKVSNETYRVGGSVSTSFNEYFGVTISETTSFLINKVEDQGKKHSRFSQLELAVDVYPAPAHSLRLGTDHYTTRGSVDQAQFYLNLGYRYTFGKKKMDLELNCTNLTNSENYVSIASSSFIISESHFQLRPRQVLMSIRIPF